MGGREDTPNDIGNRGQNQNRNKKQNKKNKSLRTINLNARSLKGKMDQLKTLIKEEEPHIIGVTESWGKEWIKDGIFAQEDYVLYRNDREDKRGGGELLYISKKLGQRECKPLNNPANGEEFDSSIWCWVTPKKGKKVLVGNIYRPPSSTWEKNRQLMNLLGRATDIAGENRLLYMGDFNAPKIDWVNMDTLPGARRFEKDLLKAAQDNFVNQHVHEYTWFRGDEKSTLDLFFTKEEEDMRNIKVFAPLGKTDHGIVVGDFTNANGKVE